MDRCAASSHPAVPSETALSAFYPAMKHLIPFPGVNQDPFHGKLPGQGF